MRFALSQEQSELAAAVRGLVARRAGSLDLRAAVESETGYDLELWEALCQQIGVASLAIPEEYGGAGFTLFETHVVLEELGAGLTPSPLLGSGILAAQALIGSGDNALAQELLPRIAEGAVVGLAWADATGRHRTDGSDVIARQQDDWTLAGTSTLVMDGIGAEKLLVVATIEGVPALFAVESAVAGIDGEPTTGLDQTFRFARLDFTDTPATLVATDFGEALTRLRAIAVIAASALQVGGAQASLDHTVAYLKERDQFERPLGSFQALKHRVADMLVRVETARSMSWAAGFAAGEGADTGELVRQAALAGSWCSESFEAVAGEMIQLHGGIAITWEHDAHLYFKRAHTLGQLFGRAHEHRAALLT